MSLSLVGKWLDWPEGIRKTLSLTLVSHYLPLSVYFPSLTQADIVLGTNEKSDMAAECFGHDGQDKRWTLPFSLLCLFGCVFVRAVSQRTGSVVLNVKLNVTECVCVFDLF